MSLIGGGLMDVDIRLPFYITAAAAAMGLLFVSLQRRQPVAALAQKHKSSPTSP